MAKSELSVNQHVWLLLQKDLAVQKDLSRGLVNIRALAKHLMETYDIRAGIDAVISAIRRYESQNTFVEDDKNLNRIFQKGIVSTKNNVACITLDVNVKRLVQRFASDRLPACKIVTGKSALKLLVDNPDFSYVKSMFSDEEILKIENDLSEISVMVSPEAIKTKGVMARIASELALANINISELVVCPPEFLIYVKERDIVKAHESVLKLCGK
ncbi:hypothetical protein HY490_04750 [Candidatus Woesearchaeota archaeon]|nr:hypothetical protein [Candidatus Woesearchaeota archaeon]